MSDTHKPGDAQKRGRDIVSWNKKEEKAYYELLGDEVGYPIKGVTGTTHWTGYFVLGPVTHRDYKKTREMLSDSVFVETVSRSDVAIKGGGSSVSGIVSQLFKRIEGLANDVSPDKQLLWLKKNENIMFKVWNTGVEGIALDIDEEKDGQLDILSMSDESDNTEYSLKQELYCQELDDVVDLELSVTLGRENHAQRQQFDSSLESILNTRKDTRKIRENLDVILGLFDQLFISSEGFLIDGNSFSKSTATAASLKKAVKSIPPQLKYLVVKEHFDSDRAKN